MMRCPFCKEINTIVYGKQTKYNAKHSDYIRYRKCQTCRETFKTHERYVPDEIIHKKK